MGFVPPSCENDLRMDSESPEYTRYAAFFGSMAALASFEELALSPKPGLVCLDSPGSHTDMDWVTFALGASALAPYWHVQASDGFRMGHYKPLRGIAEKLRATGLEMERAMYEATGGVNTHKGLIFALSLITGSSGVCARRNEFARDAILRVSGDIISPLVSMDLECIEKRARRSEKLTHGESIYLAHGLGGIRTEAAKGFPSVRVGLTALTEALSAGASLRGAAIAALLKLMTICEDTNVIHRGGMSFWEDEYRDRVRETARKFDPLEPDLDGSVREFGELLVSLGISPGGAADLLACTLFLYRSKITDNRLTKREE
ncbi:MAG: triphosphoribosyl-dephospho-CoA synthase [Synergistaceae bacterium]|jgi:triphosphoribosyl-dephospho-CoA synthetase|nr:triphosphoribosyl-dephospho-CoA synthase [Synergistaceae bacterium]